MLQKRQKLHKLTAISIQKNKSAREAPLKKRGSIKEDDRFHRAEFDPRFATIPKQLQKTRVDARFARMFTDPEFRLVTKVDRYGREVKKDEKHSNKEMEDLYFYQPDEGEQNEGEQNQLQEDEDSSQQSESSQHENSDQIRGEKEINSSSTSLASSDEEIDFEAEEDEDDLWEVLEGGTGKKSVPKSAASSNRLALQNYDWMNISAKTLILLFNSIKPPSGVVRRVSVYPSDFGLQKMAEEEQSGPRGIWVSEEGEQQQQNQPQKARKRAIRSLDNEIIVRDNDQNNDVDVKKLRRYELERLRYYYAIIECDSRATAEHIYDNYNGLEFELSTIPLDLRMVPDNVTPPHPPKEVCSDIPGAEEVHNFVNRSIGHTNVKLTWEEPQNRLSFVDKLREEDYDKVDWAQYINNDSDDEEVKKNKVKRSITTDEEELKKQAADTDWRSNFDKSSRKKNQEFEMEITFAGAFDERGNELLDGSKQGASSEHKDVEGFKERAWDRYQRNKKEKKQQLKKKTGKHTDDDYFFEGGLLPQKDSVATKEELELIVDNDQHGGTKFKSDPNDQRFAAIYDSKSGYSLDPTDRRFHENTFFLEQVRKRRKLGDQ